MLSDTFVGIDVSKARLDVAVLPSGEVFAVDNTPSGLTDLVARFSDIGTSTPSSSSSKPPAAWNSLLCWPCTRRTSP